MRLSLEQCERILERLGYHLPSLGMFEHPRPLDGARTYVSEGKVGGPKGIELTFRQGTMIEREWLRDYLLELGIDEEAVTEAFDALESEE